MKRLKNLGMVLAVFLAVALCVGSTAMAAEKKLVVGSKNFTEQQILGQIMIQLLQAKGFTCDDKTGLGGTLVARKALE
ncbi:MAG: glycine betaine ABC transporter substrate-binding protein, partial [Desulfobacterales bacterium]